MMTNKEKNSSLTENGETDYVPFVNEECGDTMWDEVLKEAEDRDKKEEWKSFDFSFKL